MLALMSGVAVNAPGPPENVDQPYLLIAEERRWPPIRFGYRLVHLGL